MGSRHVANDAAINAAAQVAPAGAETRAGPQASAPSLRYAWFVVAVLTVVYVFSFIDRQIFSFLVGPLRRDLHITDTQVSLLMGFSFAVFYTFFGIPIGRLVDVYNRRTVIAGGLSLWSAFTTCCGLARTFPRMLALRMGVGVGEAALSPAAYSIITDYFPPQKLATAISVYSMGIWIGSGLSYLVGGIVVRYASEREEWVLPLVGAIHPWQMIFFLVGLPGLLLVPLLFAVREPAARRMHMARAAVPMPQVLTYIYKNCATFLMHNIGFGLIALATYASAGWIPEFYRRDFHWDSGKIGLVYGSIVAVFGCLGAWGAGRVADHWRLRGRQNAALLVGAIVAIAMVPLGCLVYLAPSARWATIFLIPTVVLSAAPFGIAPAAIQQMMPAAMRGQASAVYLFIVNIIGLGVGPTAVAACTQYVFGRDSAVRYSLALVTAVVCTAAAVLLWAAAGKFIDSLEYLREWEKGGYNREPVPSGQG
jgi:MFS family permease